jgi:hypothetical protein
VSKVFLLALKGLFQIYFVKISIVSKENTFETGLFLNSSDTSVVNDVEEFFVPAQFFVVVNNWTEIDVRRVSCLKLPGTELLL